MVCELVASMTMPESQLSRLAITNAGLHADVPIRKLCKCQMQISYPETATGPTVSCRHPDAGIDGPQG